MDLLILDLNKFAPKAQNERNKSLICDVIKERFITFGAAALTMKMTLCTPWQHPW